MTFNLLIAALVLCVSLLGLGGVRLRRNIKNLQIVIDDCLAMERLARSRELASIWGVIAPTVSRSSAVRFTSQRGEDFHIWQLLNYKKTGFFVDIGAYDGVRASNSHALEQLGWHGLLVEANPACVAKCRMLRPSSDVVHAAVAGPFAGGSTVFHTVSGAVDADMLSYVSSSQPHAEMCRRANVKITSIEVPLRSLNALLDEHCTDEPRIDLLSIDIEGLELLALQGLDFQRWSPRAIIAEANDPELMPFLEAHGYRRAATVGANWLFVLGTDDDTAVQLPEFEFIRY